MKRKYHAPEGATSISIGGESFEVDKHGLVAVPDEADHNTLLAHGYRLEGDAVVVDAPVLSAAEADAVRALNARATDLDAREQALDAREVALNQRQADLDALATATASLSAGAPPPPPPAPAKKK